MFVLKLCEKNSSVNLRFKIFIVAFRPRKLFGTFEKRTPGLKWVISNFGSGLKQGRENLIWWSEIG